MVVVALEVRLPTGRIAASRPPEEPTPVGMAI